MKVGLLFAVLTLFVSGFDRSAQSGFPTTGPPGNIDRRLEQESEVKRINRIAKRIDSRAKPYLHGYGHDYGFRVIDSKTKTEKGIVLYVDSVTNKFSKAREIISKYNEWFVLYYFQNQALIKVTESEMVRDQLVLRTTSYYRNGTLLLIRPRPMEKYSKENDRFLRQAAEFLSYLN